jgi:hypothetical protein
LAAIDVRGWESVSPSGQIEHDSEAGRVLVNGGEAVDVATIAASTTIDKLHDHVRVDAAAGDVVITLPDAVRFVGRRFTLKKTDVSTHTVTIQGQGGQTIDASASKSTTIPWTVFRLYSTGDNWEMD